ncbi:MAG: hypothetical protein KF744_09195 [Taibaiella sp.]|nr:hypothetical protein [Taibaiella sp.]
MRDLPYLPLFVDDWMSDEKLAECSPHATGVYIWLICLMKKSEEYGVILLKQKDKQSNKPVQNFAVRLARNLPWSVDEIARGLEELVNEGVVKIEGDRMMQKRMIRDAKISVSRSDTGKKGAEAKRLAKANQEAHAKKFAKAKVEANTEANSVANTGMEWNRNGEGENEEMGVQGEEEQERGEIHGLTLPWDSEEFAKWWGDWKDYLAAQHGQGYRAVIAENGAMEHLWRLAKGDERVGIEIIRYSIGQRYKNFYLNNELKDGTARNGSAGNGQTAGNAGKTGTRGGTIGDLDGLKRGGAPGSGERTEFTEAQVVE